jgi:phosphate transport system substrate-binding protein
MSYASRALIVSLGASLSLLCAAAQAGDITGAGATVPYPIYAKWAEAYGAKSGVHLNYQSIGSGGGIKQIKAKTVDFGASDKPLTPEELAKDNLFQFPMIVGGVVPTVNVEGIKPGQLKLTGPLLADIYLGKVKKWNDPAIVALNPGLALPAKDIVAISRSDGSGTTFIFTNYLSKVSPEWKTKVGEGTAVNWPSNGVGGKGNEGVSQYVQRLPNSIGYVEYAYAKQNKMAYTLLKNEAGNFVAPDEDTFKAAAANASWSKTFYQVLTGQPGKDSWPITAATFIMVYKVQDKPTVASNVLKFFDWAYTGGDAMANELDYVPMPDSVKALVRKLWADQVKDAAGKPIAFK